MQLPGFLCALLSSDLHAGGGVRNLIVMRLPVLDPCLALVSISSREAIIACTISDVIYFDSCTFRYRQRSQEPCHNAP